MRRCILILSSLLLLWSCNRAELIDITSLGAREKVMTIPSGAVEDTIKIITNVPYEASVFSGEDWIQLAGSGIMPSSRKEIPFSCKANMSWKRMAKVTLAASGRVDTVFVRQEGALPDRISLKDKSFHVPAKGGTYSTEVECFRYPDGILLDVSNKAWQASIEGNTLTVVASPATSRDPKTHTVSAYYIDGWGERSEAILTFTQDPRE